MTKTFETSSPWRQDLAWVILFFGTRLLILLSIGQKIVFSEELYNGRIGYEILTNGFTLNPQFQFLPFAGGTLVEGFLSIATFKLMGYSLFSLKIIPVLFITGAVWMWRIYLRQTFSLLSANIMTLFMLFPPPFLSKISTVAWGNHLESTFLIATALVLVSLSMNARHRSGWTVWLGIWSGLSIYFISSYLLLMIAGGMVIMTQSLMYRLRFHWRSFFAGLCVGLVPWIATNILWNFRGLKVFGSFNQVPVDLGTRFIQFVMIHLPTSTGFFDGYGSDVRWSGSIYWFIGLILVMGVRIPHSRRRAFSGSGIIWLYMVLFWVAVSVGSFHFKPVESPLEFRSYRYLAPLYPMLFATMALGASGWIHASKRCIRVTGLIMVSCILGAGIISTYRLLEPPSKWFGVFAAQDYSGLKEHRQLMEFQPDQKASQE
jgi:4-amino-4-deoxy-L-arabinose transferase-like glycosyltransferase